MGVPRLDGRTSLVLGGRGFIGSHLVDRLLELGSRVRSFDRPLIQSVVGAPAVVDGLSFIDGDFTSDADVGAAIEGCQYCFHLVSTTLPKTSNVDPVYDVETNLISTIKLLKHAADRRVRVIFVSSGGTVYGRPRTVPIPEHHPTEPTCSYGITKLSIEKYLELFRQLQGLEYCVLRLSNPYGERQRTEAAQGAVAVFLGKALRGEAIEVWGDGSVIRDYIHISDVIEAMVSAIGSRADRVFNIGSGVGMSLNTVLDTIERVCGAPVQRHYSVARAFDVPTNVLDISFARSSLGWEPKVGFEEGVARTATWLLKEWGRNPDARIPRGS